METRKCFCKLLVICEGKKINRHAYRGFDPSPNTGTLAIDKQKNNDCDTTGVILFYLAFLTKMLMYLWKF